MKLIETNKYVVKQNVPYFDLGDIYINESSFKYEDYPNVFSKVYEFETGEITYIGQQIYRIKGDKIKPVYLTKDNLDLELFPTQESAEKFLQENEEKFKQESIERQYKQKLRKIKFLSSTDNIEKLSIHNIKVIFNHIQDLCKDVE